MSLKRYKGIVGKLIGGNIYVHRDYASLVIPNLQKSIALIKSIPYTIVKYNTKTQSISFIECNDFDTNPEPIVGDVTIINGKNIKKIKSPKDPWIYHHKWLMVTEDYEGFNVQESILRSESWMNKGFDCSRIGKLSYWNKLMKE
jgi:hypothetical protein